MFDSQGFVGNNMVFQAKIIGVNLAAGGETDPRLKPPRGGHRVGVLFSPDQCPMSRSRSAIDVSPYLIDPGRLSESVAPIDWASLFGNTNPIELEIGSGKGLFLVARRSLSPPLITWALSSPASMPFTRGAACSLPGRERQSVVRRCARRDRRLLCPPRACAESTCIFPTRGGKPGTRLAGLFTAELVRQIERTLQIGGQLRVASDVLEYFGVIRGLIAESGRLHEQQPAAPAQPGQPERSEPLNYLTHFDRKYRIEGRAIYQSQYVLG